MRVLLLLLFFADTAFAQSGSLDFDNKVYEPSGLSRHPQFPGGEQALLKFLTSNIHLPVGQDENNFPGKTLAAFIINKDGSISEIEIIKGEAEFGKEVKRVIASMPRWSPGEVDGQRVRTRVTLPVRLHPDRSETVRTPSTLLRQLDSATVWDGVRVATEQVFGEKNIELSFKIKNKAKRASLIAVLEGQFQVNISAHESKSFKRAKDLSDYIFQAQQGIVMFSKTNFQGKVERFATNRRECKEGADCLNFIGSVIVPKGYVATLYNQPKYKGEQMVIDASKEEVRINSFIVLHFDGPISTTNTSVNWREEVQSIRIIRAEK